MNAAEALKSGCVALRSGCVVYAPRRSASERRGINRYLSNLLGSGFRVRGVGIGVEGLWWNLEGFGLGLRVEGGSAGTTRSVTALSQLNCDGLMG